MSVIAEETVETAVDTAEEASVEVADEVLADGVVDDQEGAAMAMDDESPVEKVIEEEEPATESTDTVSVTFAPDDPEADAKVAEVLEKYEIPTEILAVIDHFKAKAEAPSAEFAAYAEYGDADAIKALLDRQALLDSVTETETGYRPNTDKFTETLDADKAGWLFYDLGRRPSQKYQGLTQFEEGIADALAIEGDTVGSVLTRYKQAVDAFKGAPPIAGATPDFIPPHLQEAYWSLSKEDRDELEMFSPDTDRIEQDETTGQYRNIDEPVRQRKLDMLAKIQKGIDGDKLFKEQEVKAQTERQQAFNQDVITTQEKFYASIRDTFAADLMKSVQFSTDPKMQALLANQNVSLLTQAFLPDADGEWARQALAEAGVNFDTVKAQQLVKDIETAAVMLAQARQIQEGYGQSVNQVELNKARAKFEKAGKEWQAFTKDLLNQEAALTSTGKQRDIDKAADAKLEKKKMAIKARPSTKGTPSPTTTKTPHKVPDNIRYGTPQWDEYWYNLMQEEAKNGNRAYAQVG